MKRSIHNRLRYGGAVGFLTLAALSSGRADPPPKHQETITLDAQSWNPLSLVVRERHLAEAAFGDDIKIEYLPAADSTVSLARLGAGITDVASASTLAASVARANGGKVKLVLVWGQPHWAAIMVRAEDIPADVGGLKGDRVALGNEEARFTLNRALAAAGLGPRDVTQVPQSELDGRIALEQSRVDAWVASDPQRAAAQREAGDRILAGDPAITVPGVLAVREAYAAAHPDRVAKLMTIYAQARSWANDHPQDLARMVAQAAAMSPASATDALGRTNLDFMALDDQIRTILLSEIADLQTDGRINADVAADTIAGGLLDAPTPRLDTVKLP